MLRSSSRELSSRVDLNVHRERNRFRRATWWLALWAGLGSLLWVLMEHSRGENQIYQAGDVANPHRLIENECWRCHNTWVPLKRLNPLGIDTPEFGQEEHRFGNDLHSIDNEKCQKCHRVGEHHVNQSPAHDKISCAACHQEHEGAESLTSPNDQHCIFCHNDLKEHGDKAGLFANRVSRFDREGGHPEFRLLSLTKGDANIPPPPKEHGVNRAVEFFQRPLESRTAAKGDEKPKWQDRGRIFFNHALHLKPGLSDKNRKLVDLSHRCDECHEPDQGHRFLKPINFESHCRGCHPLLFDHFNFPGQSVPHEAPNLVRSFLTEQYTLRAISGTLVNPENEKPDALSRPFPGHRDFQRQKVPNEQFDTVRDGASRAEKNVRDSVVVAVERAKNDCRYCHELESAESKPATGLADWKIVPTKIPSRWFAHGEFHHESHRLLSCAACHSEVFTSTNTGDVLIPSIDVCRACHAARPQEWAGKLPASAASETPKHSDALPELPSNVNETLKPNKEKAAPEPLKNLLLKVNRGARTSCIECHVYHDPKKDEWNGPLVR